MINAVNEPQTSSQPMTSLDLLKIMGTAASGAMNDGITVTISGTPHGAIGDNRFPDLGDKWQEVEFNVFGDGDSSQAVFNSGSALVVRTAVTAGTMNWPGCDVRTFTGESSNLTLLNVAPKASKGSMPALVFSEVYPAPGGLAATCANATKVGNGPLLLILNQLLGN